jgi:hypothetical protein
LFLGGVQFVHQSRIAGVSRLQRVYHRLVH